ncbi:MAG: DNA mismatch repair endonuclease MutL [Oscillospiraceae bacterium]|jgi:DNA mismatch repair protein MutL|nr:DNA mismatch repair endonuclease MutL [Oscillospiraceae bacterium]
MIQVLPQHIADLIAAGEVVERPASVVKELCENALDAGASALTVELRGGGIQYLRVTDNGCGIPRAQLPTAFLPHATSKISAADDLERILTLGFRGEALPSIAAVARVQVLTRAQEEENGSCYEIHAGKEISLEDAGCPVGTTVMVRDLFYHTPARMKFLKKDVTEGNYAAAAAERMALSRPDVAITLIREGKTVFQTPGDGSPAGAVRAVLGKEFYSGLLGVKSVHMGIEVSGFLSEPRAARPNRGWQYFFLNGRYIKCPTASAALGEAYKHSLMSGKYPACVLYLTLPAGMVDVNVHPAKLEVRFADERPVFSAVYQAAVGALQGSGTREREGFRAAQTVASALPQRRDDFWQRATAIPAEAGATEYRSAGRAIEQLNDPDSAANPFIQEANPIRQATRGGSLASRLPSPAPPPEPSLLPPAVRVIGELFHTYFLAELGDELLLIDKHAAHERIIFERLRAEQGAVQTQVLLEPLALSLSREEAAALLENKDLLEQAGFVIDAFGGDTLLLRECPMLLTGVDLAAQAAEIAGYLLQNRQRLETKALDWIFSSAACRAAIKAGDPTTPAERERFVERLLAMPDIRTCPHGRPVMAVLTRTELERRFGRIA